MLCTDLVVSLSQSARSDIITKRAATYRQLPVSFNEMTPKDAHLPIQIEQQWRSALAFLVREDLLQEKYGARRHNILANCDLMYRLDVSSETLS